MPPLLPGDDITVVIMPFCALLGGAEDKMKKLGISYSHDTAPGPGVRIVLFSIEVTLQESTLRWMSNDPCVRRIVVDEAHLALIWSNFRLHYFYCTHELAKTGKQVILLTATVPFKQHGSLLASWGLCRPTLLQHGIHTAQICGTRFLLLISLMKIVLHGRCVVLTWVQAKLGSCLCGGERI